jgi:photosystem II stability/assembly factor-like uncharacterized protein
MARSTAAPPPRRGRTKATRARVRPGAAGRRLPTLAVVLVVIALVGGFLALRARGADGAALATLTTADFHALAFSPTDPDVAFFGYHNGLLRTDDGGKTWRPLVERRGFDAMNLAVDRSDPRRLYLAGHDVFQVSTDGGVSWQPEAHNLPGTDIHGFAMNPDDANRLAALVVGQGAFASGDGGHTWQRLEGRLPGDVMALASAGGSPETLYAASMAAGVLRSADGGRSWAAAANGLGGGGATALAIDPADRRVVYAGTGGGLYRSADGGTSWARLPFPGDNVAALAVSPARPGRVLAIAVQGGRGLVYRSDDGGQSWDAGR